MPDHDHDGPFEEVLPARDGSDSPRAWGFARRLPTTCPSFGKDPEPGEGPLGCFNAAAVMRRGGWSSLHYHPYHHNEFSISVGRAVVATRHETTGRWQVAMLGGDSPMRTLTVTVRSRARHLFFALRDATVVTERYVWTTLGCRIPWIKRITSSGFAAVDAPRDDDNEWIDAGKVAAKLEMANDRELAGLCAAIARRVAR